MASWTRLALRSSRTRLRCSFSSTRLLRSDETPPFDENASFKVLRTPWPAWKFGTGQRTTPGLDTEGKYRSWTMNEMHPLESYKLLTSAIVPRPIAFVSSISEEGYPNLAPFSQFSLVSHNPPLVSVAFTLSRKRPKDTRENILQTKEFTVNIIGEHLVEAANATAVEAPADIDEWIVSGLTMEPSDVVKPARVKESAVSMECELFSFQDIQPYDSDRTTATLVLGLIKKMHVRSSILQPDGLNIDAAKLRPVARLGGSSYARMTEGFDLPRPSMKALMKEYGDSMEPLKKRRLNTRE